MPDSKPFEYNNSAFSTDGLVEIMRENQNEVLCDLNNCENDAAPVALEINDKDEFWNTPELDCTMVVEDYTNGNGNGNGNEARDSMKLFEKNSCADKNGNENEVRDENEFKDSVDPFTIPSGKMELFEKNTDLYTDKNVMKCELPELIVCYKESTYHVVKDICIDEGLPFEDKILIESESDNDKGLHSVLPSDENSNGGKMKENKDTELLSPDGSKSSSENEDDEDDAHECGTKEKVAVELHIADALKSLLESHSDNDISTDCGSLALVQAGETNPDATEMIADDVSRENFVTSSMPSLQKFSKQISLKSLFESPDCDANEVEQQSGQISSSEVKCENPALVSIAEESNQSDPGNDLPYNSKVESSTITFDFNSSKPTTNGTDENLNDVDPEQPLKIDSKPSHENGISDSLAVESEVQHGQGESSFSMAGPVSGRISYSGPLVYSGSVSLRSDSSTTSARSFAFPVLPSEWNSSPVRMAKADRRHYRKHRGWRRGFLCCKF